MAKRIITNPKFIVERDGDNWVLKFKDGNIYKPIEFNNAQFSGKKNMVISQPNFSIIDDKLYVNINGHDVKIGEVGDGYTLVSKLTRNSIVEPNLDVVITSNGGASVVTEIGGKNITINGGNEQANRLYYTVVEGGHKPESTWITENCIDNVFNTTTGEGYLLLRKDVTTLKSYDKNCCIFTNISADSNILSVKIPQQITRIGSSAFYGCSELETVIFDCQIDSIGSSAFNGCTRLKPFTIPDSVTKINGHAFENCTSLLSVVLGNRLDDIKPFAFYNTGTLSVTCLATTPPQLALYNFGVPGSTLYVPIDSLTAYEESNWSSVFTNIQPIGYSHITVNYTGSGSVEISDNSYWLENGKIVTIGAGETVEDWEFIQWSDGNTDKNREIVVDGNVTYTAEFVHTKESVITYVSESELKSGEWLLKCTDTIKNTYDDKTKVGVLYLLDGVDSIGGGTSTDYSPFYNNKEVTSVDMSNCLIKVISGYSFYTCDNLISVKLPENLYYIGDHAFKGCSRLTEITIPVMGDKSTIASQAFKDCSSLTTVTSLSENPPVLDGANIFTGIGTTTCYLSPDASDITVTDYVESDWKNYFDTFVRSEKK